jgi:hypothetical protein
MGRLALTHRGSTKARPPLELLEPFIERTDNHWYWLDEFYDDGLDRSAVFVWAAPAESKAHYMVPRLLWQLANPSDTERVLLENTCGLFTCINPAHWRKRQGAVRIPARIVLPEHVEAMPVISSHLVTVHIRRLDVQHTVCGEVQQVHGGSKKTVITCDDCISAWVRSGQPYTEVT